jgi:hypothetical protein
VCSRRSWVQEGSRKRHCDGRDHADARALLDELFGDERSDLLGEAVPAVTCEFIEGESAARTGTAHGRRSSQRCVQPSGYRARCWDTRVDTVRLAVPKLRLGSSYPSFLESRRMGEDALLAVAAETHEHRTCRRKVEDPAAALRIACLSRSEVCRISGLSPGQGRRFQLHGYASARPVLWCASTRDPPVYPDGRPPKPPESSSRRAPPAEQSAEWATNGAPPQPRFAAEPAGTSECERRSSPRPCRCRGIGQGLNDTRAVLAMSLNGQLLERSQG